MLNKETNSFITTIKEFWKYIPRFRKKQFVFIILLSFLSSIFEIISISAALPFISVLIEPEKIYNNELLHTIFISYGLNHAAEIVLPVTIIFVVAIFISTSLRLVLLWANNKLAFNTGIDISIDIYNKVLSQPYIFHTTKNSSDIINLIYNKVSEIIFYIIISSIILITSGIMSVVITGLLFYFMSLSVAWVILLFIVAYVFIINIIKKQLKENSKIIADESTKIVKTVQEGLGGIRDILIDKTQTTFKISYENSVQNLRHSQSKNQIFGAAPKFFLEAIGLIFVAFFAYSLSLDSIDNSTIVPILVGVVLSMQRLLPLFQQMFNAWSQMQSAQASLEDVIEYLNLKIPENLNEENNKSTIRFNKVVKLNNINFQYSSHMPLVLKAIDLDITKGSRIGFIGSTGSGKSTLLDIIMGLLEPSSGSMSIDGVILSKSNIHLWQKLIAHVPQSIYLIDSTIEQNIAFGIEEDKIDKELVLLSAQKAQIADVIKNMPKGYKTIIGERGVQLSGGQRQRLGIARAFYKKAQVIILDEATSALDNETEMAVVESFERMGEEITLLMIAHRISTLKNCTDIVEIKEGNIHRIIKYKDLKDFDGNA